MQWDADDELPPRALLDAWEVPEPPSDLENAIMSQIDAAAPAAKPFRGPNSLIVPLLAGVAAAALVVAWLALTRTPAAPVPVEVIGPGPAPTESEPAAVPRAMPELGVLTLNVDPDEAEILVDGKPLGGSSPFIVSGVEVGKTIELELSAPGRLSVKRIVEVPAAATVDVHLAEKSVMVSTELTPPTIELELEAVSESGTTRRPVGQTFLLERDRETDYFLIAKAPHHLERRLRIGFSGRSAQFIDVVLEPDPRSPKPRPKAGVPPNDPDEVAETNEKRKSAKAMTATLLIGTNMGVSPAKVYVDGTFIGTTPQSDVAVTPGRHTVKWQWSNGKKITQSVTVADGQRKIVRAG